MCIMWNSFIQYLYSKMNKYFGSFYIYCLKFNISRVKFLIQLLTLAHILGNRTLPKAVRILNKLSLTISPSALTYATSTVYHQHATIRVVHAYAFCNLFHMLIQNLCEPDQRMMNSCVYYVKNKLKKLHGR